MIVKNLQNHKLCNYNIIADFNFYINCSTMITCVIKIIEFYSEKKR